MNHSEILIWDSDFFGFNIAKVNDDCLSPDVFDTFYQELKNKKVKLIYWPSNINCVYQQEIADKFGGIMVDIKTTYEKKLTRTEKFPLENQAARYFLYNNTKPDERLLDIAVQCGEHSRFNVDPDFPEPAFVKLYKTWIIKSLSGEMADGVIVTVNDGLASGLVTVACKNDIGDIGLIGVDLNYRGKGLGSILLKAAINYFIDKECLKVSVVTQGKNENACRLYEKYGFKITRQVNFYHFWIK